MNKEVIINISGLQLDAGTEEPIELMTTGDYYLKNGKHYRKKPSQDQPEGRGSNKKGSQQLPYGI